MAKLPLYHTEDDSLISQARYEVGFPEPPTGGDDRLTNAFITRHLNWAHAEMSRVIGGFPAYMEFTVTSDDTYELIWPIAAPPTLTKSTVTSSNEQVWFTLSNARSYGIYQLNLTTAVGDNERVLYRIDSQRPDWQSRLRTGTDYIQYYDIHPNLGYRVLPPVDVTNTIGLYYRANPNPFVYTGTDSDIATLYASIPEEFEQTIIDYAAHRAALRLDDIKAKAFYAAYKSGLQRWDDYVNNIDLGTFFARYNPLINQPSELSW